MIDSGVLIFVIIVLFVIWYLNNRNEDMYEHFMAKDAKGGKYMIHMDMPRPKSAVAKLSKLNAFIVRVIEGMKNRYLHRDDLPTHQAVAQRLVRDYNPGELFEQKPNNGTITSFVTNKGEKVTFCLRDITNYDLHNDHILNFVALHEISHIGTEGIGHHHEFWRNFRIVLESAMLDRLHKPKDYRKTPEDYCGKHINYSPLYDDRLDYVSVLK